MTPTDLTPMLAKLTRQMQTLQTRYLHHLGLGTGQSLILREILSHYGINEAQLSHMINLDKSTVSRAVKRLVDAGYVERKRNPSDRRSHYLVSTNMAKVFEPQFDIAAQSLAEALLLGFKEEEAEEFGKYLRRASSNVNHVLHSPPANRFHRFLNLPNP